MADPESLVAQVVSDNEESEQNDGRSGSYESPSIHVSQLKGSDLLA
jgi:hypothetical protein